MSDNWRKIDIDQWDEDRVLEDDLAPVNPRSPDEQLASAWQAGQKARQLVSSGDQAGALTALLTDPPYGPDQQVGEAKSQVFASVLEVLNSTRSTDISKTIAALDLDQHDLLMAYLYKGLAHPENGAAPVLLQWHEKLTEVAGAGSIVRVMTDRRDL